MQTTYARDGAGKELSRTEAAYTASARTINTSWNSNFPLPAEIDEPTHQTNFTYDANGNVLTKVVTDLTTYTAPYGTNGQTRTWTYTYTPQGLLATATDPMPGLTTTYAYNGDGYLSSVTDPLNHVTQITAWNGRGEPTTVVDPNGVTTNLAYDMDGHPTGIVINPGSAQSAYAFAYDAAGDLTQVTLPGGGYLQYAYDDARRLTLVTNNRSETKALTYDANDDVLSTTLNGGSGTLAEQETRTYDELGRLLTFVGAGGSSQTSTFGYDLVGNQTQTTDARSKLWTTTFDPLNRMIAKSDPEQHQVQYAYAADDSLTSHTDARSLQTTRVVDGLGEVIQEVSPDRGTRTYWYDAAGRMTKWVDGDGEETDLAYDNAGRITGKTFPNGAAEAQTFTYDATANGNEGVGRLTGVTDETGSSVFTYDAQGRVTSDTRTINGLSHAVAYAYDANGKVIRITYPSGRVVSIARTTDGLATGVSTSASAGAIAQTTASSVTYAPFGPLTGLTYGNGLVLANSYDGNYWLNRTQVAAGTTTRLDLTFNRDGTGALTNVTDNASSGRGANYGYTDAGRLQYAVGPWGEWDYAYDGAGNMIERDKVVGGTKTFEFHITQPGTNRLTQVQDGSETPTRNLIYRNGGGDLYQDNQVNGEYLTYSYNALKRPVQLMRNGWLQAYYGYNAFGQRVSHQVFSIFGITTGLTQYTYDLNGHVLAEESGSNAATVFKEYIWLDDQLLAIVDSTGSSPATYYVHAGQIGEPLVLTDSTQAKVWDGFVDPYGIAQTFSSATASIDLRFPGQWLQSESGLGPLYQNGMREYDPTLGRYVQADPLGLAAGQNVYAYVDGRVTTAADPAGLQVAQGAAIGAEAGGLPGAVVGGLIGLAAGAAIDHQLHQSHAPAQNQCIDPKKKKDHCIEQCYRLLERWKPHPGSDKNTFDFHKCVSQCMEDLGH